MRHAVALFLVLFALIPSAQAGQIRTEAVKYTLGGEGMVGYLAYDADLPGRRPGILVVHEWWGLNDFIKGRAVELAKLGYIAFAADIYGKGFTTKKPEEAERFSSIYRKNRQLLRARVNAAFGVLARHELADPRLLAATGYCFGGMAVLELARSGAAVRGVASFHGILDTPDPDEARNIRGSVLILQGADDPVVPMAQRIAFQNEMETGGVDWQMNIYGHAVHAFTNPASGVDPSKGVAYHPRADRRSWEAMKLFLTEIFSKRM